MNAARSQNPRHIDGYASDFVLSDRSNLTSSYAPKCEVIFTRALCAFLLLSPALFAQAGAKNASANLESLGFTLLQSTPIDFELQALSGSRLHLKDIRGKWILLAFWATWCGPCNEEMPQLESLYRKFKKDGLSVIGVSVDQDRFTVEAFQKEKGITFPILLDSESNISSKYRASALPTLYAISPDWKLVGVLRGARDWSHPETSEQVAALLGNREYKEKDIGIKMVEEDGGLTLPNNLVPPVLSVELPTKDIRPGANLPLIVSVTWKGNPKDYIIKAPKLTLPEGVTQGEVSSSSTSENENTTLRYHFPLKVEKEGSLKLGPVELAYSPRTGGKELFSRNEGPTIEARNRDWTQVVVPIVCAVIIFSLAGFWFMHRKKPRIIAKKPTRNWRGPYEEIRPLKMKGQKSEYMTALLKLNIEIDDESGTRNLATQALLEKLKFAGSALSDMELMNLEKRVELAVRNQASKVEES